MGMCIYCFWSFAFLPLFLISIYPYKPQLPGPCGIPQCTLLDRAACQSSVKTYYAYFKSPLDSVCCPFYIDMAPSCIEICSPFQNLLILSNDSFAVLCKCHSVLMFSLESGPQLSFWWLPIHRPWSDSWSPWCMHWIPAIDSPCVLLSPPQSWHHALAASSPYCV